MNTYIRIALALILAQFSGWALAQQNTEALESLDNRNTLRLQFSPYSKHFNANTKHKPVVLIGVEREYPNAKLDGIALFSNSFGQECVYIYPWGGSYKSILGVKPLSFKWTAGLIYGYKPPYENKVPFNHKGFSPGAIIALNYEFKPGWSAQINMLGTAGYMLQLDMPFNGFR
jgi:hypothetical protein